MQTEALTPPGTASSLLQALSWILIALAALWLISAVISFFYRRAYNLTHAESGRSKDIKPDFLKVDKNKRQAALDRGSAYDAVLDARETAGPARNVEKVRFWSRIAAGLVAILALGTTIVTTFMNVDAIQEGINKFSSWDRFSQLVGEHKTAAVVAIVVIGSNIIVTVKTLKKTPGKD